MIVANKNLIQLISKKFERPMPDGTNQLVDFFALLRKLLLAGFPLYSEPSSGAMRTIMSEAEKSKCLRFLLSAPFAVILRISTEFN